MISPVFLSVPGGELYLSRYLPGEGDNCRGWVIHAPAFAEEMNKSRPMVSCQARLLAAQGYCVLVPDLFGTGDSAGEFGDADWSRWTGDLDAVVRWALEQGAPKVCLWGLRTGALLALEVARVHPEMVRQLLFWQPVLNGKQFVTQFLRLRMAAGLAGGLAETTASLREMLSGGDSIEVAGYDISPRLVSQLDEVSALALAPPPALDVSWFEIVAQEDRPLTPVSRRVIESWQEAGIAVNARTIIGDGFWATQEIARAPALLESTVEILCASKPVESSPAPAIDPGTATNSAGDTATLVFGCASDELVGVLHKGDPSAKLAVLVVVGGPQYRVGSHRQFVHLARALAHAGVPVLRFDYRGLGDSSGELVGFEGVGEDITAALDALQSALPGVERFVIWGLCDAASAAAFYAPGDDRVAGLVLLNPWVRSEAGEARAYIKHYYLQRFFSREFWGKLMRGKLDLSGSLRSLWGNLQRASTRSGRADPEPRGGGPQGAETGDNGKSLAERVFQGLATSRCPVLCIISGNDLTAAEFLDAVSSDRGFRKLLKSARITRRDLAEADHTFSRRQWRDQVSRWTLEWIASL